MEIAIKLDQQNIDKRPMYTGSESKYIPLTVIASKALIGAVIGSIGLIILRRECALSRGQINPVYQAL